MEESWIPNVPKIPLSLLYSTVNFFREIYKKMKSEVYVQFYYDVKEEEYILHCPDQTVSGASVNYKNDEEYQNDNFVLVLEMHSHGSMGAFFSGTDDKDEKADRFFGVVGHVSRQDPEMKFRLCLGGKATEVSMFSIFQSEEYDTTFPEEWLDKVKEEKVVRGWKGKGKFGGGYYGGSKNYGGNKYYGGRGSINRYGANHYSSAMDTPLYGYGWEDYMDYRYNEMGAEEPKQTKLFDDIKSKFSEAEEDDSIEISDELEKALEDVGSSSISGAIEYGNYIREDGMIHFVDDEGVVISSIDDDVLTDEDVYEDVDGSFYEGEDID